jgi:hypothetical protein
MIAIAANGMPRSQLAAKSSLYGKLVKFRVQHHICCADVFSVNHVVCEGIERYPIHFVILLLQTVFILDDPAGRLHTNFNLGILTKGLNII